MKLCSNRAHLNSPGRPVYTCLVEKIGLRLADNRHLSHNLLEIGRLQLGPSLAIPYKIPTYYQSCVFSFDLQFVP